jgi:hypothetical protein
MVLVKIPQHFYVQANNRQQTRARGTRQNSKRFVALSFYLALDSEASDFGLLFCHAAKNFFHRNIAILEHRIAVCLCLVMRPKALLSYSLSLAILLVVAGSSSKAR